VSFCPSAVIFDMDGLLVDSEPVWNKVETAVIEARGKVVTPERNAGLVGLRLDEYWAGMCRAYQIDENPQTLANEAISNMCGMIAEHVVTRAGALELIEFLLAQNVPVAIASSSPKVIIDTVVETHGWRDVFRVRVSGDEVARGKPAPDVYLEAARRIGANPAETLALEDSVNGARAAVAAGMVCYAVPDLTHATHAMFDLVTPHVFDSLDAVLAQIRTCFL